MGEGIFNNRLLFKNEMLLFFLLFSGNFCGGGNKTQYHLLFSIAIKTSDLSSL